ncbi:Uncharacterised protein [Mycoplasma putrefaciens]|nr:Uncharacterised protein [Mycoplasma putrefaciens]
MLIPLATLEKVHSINGEKDLSKNETVVGWPTVAFFNFTLEKTLLKFEIS